MKKSLAILVILILAVGITFTSISAQEKYEIPSWVRDVAGFWVSGEINDQDFGDALSFLINENIIKIPENAQLQDENSQLQNENSQLKNSNAQLQDENSQLQNENSEVKDLLVQRDDELVNALDKINQLQQEVSDLKSNRPVDEIITSKPSLTVSVDKVVPYEKGDMVKITGNIVNIEGVVISLQIINPDDVVHSDQLSPKADGSFFTSFVMGDPPYDEFGKYVIKVKFGSVEAETSLWYNPS